MRARRASLRAAAAVLGLAAGCGLGACQSSPPPALPAAPEPKERARAFDAQRAWVHLEALAGLGTRTSGSEGHERARAYIREQLEAIGLEFREPVETVRLAGGDGSGEEREIYNLVALIPGESDELFLLVAPYDTRPAESFEFVGANDGGSGAALLLEITRVLAALPLRYTTWVVFLDGEASFTPADPDLAPAARSRLGSRLLARRLAQHEALEQVRLALALNRVCDPDLRIARDSLSHRAYREAFWAAARRLGEHEAFSREAHFEPTDESHLSLREAGLLRVVAIADTAFGGDAAPGLYAGSEDDDLEHCAEASLGAVGRVVLEALSQISDRLAKVDRFVQPGAPTPSIGLDILEGDEDGGDAEDAEESEASETP